MNKYFIFLSLIFLIEKSAFNQNTCTVSNVNFTAGEKLTYVVSYNWFVIFTDVGEFSLSVKDSKIGDIPCLHLEGIGSTYPAWDMFFKVRDRYESWVNPQDIKPYYFKRKVYEGGYEMEFRDIFSRKKNYATTTYSIKKAPEKRDTIPIHSCTFDVVSVLYYARTIDFSNLKQNDTVKFEILLDRKIEQVYFIYRGTENMKIKKIGEFKCEKISISLVAGSVFKEGAAMDIWITSDRNHIPVYAESPIIVGSVKIKLLSYDGLKYPLVVSK